MKLAALTLALSLSLSRVGLGEVFTGSIDGPNNAERFRLDHPAGDFAARITADATLTPTVGLFDASGRLLALTGPGESLYAVVPAGRYELVVTGEGVGRYSIDVTGGTAVPEPAAAVVLLIIIIALLLRRRSSAAVEPARDNL